MGSGGGVGGASSSSGSDAGGALAAIDAAAGVSTGSIGILFRYAGTCCVLSSVSAAGGASEETVSLSPTAAADLGTQPKPLTQLCSSSGAGSSSVEDAAPMGDGGASLRSYARRDDRDAVAQPRRAGPWYRTPRAVTWRLHTREAFGVRCERGASEPQRAGCQVHVRRASAKIL